MTSVRGLRETLKALRDKMADVQQRIVWVSHDAGEGHAEAVERALAKRGLTGAEPGLMLIAWLPPSQGGAEEQRANR